MTRIFSARIFSIFGVFRLFILFCAALISFPFVKNKSIYFFFKFAGPTLIKLGQLLSNRPDLVGEDLAQILEKFQDRLPPFSFKYVKQTIRGEFGKNIKEIFSEFNKKPIASASIAQVHKAKTKEGGEVAVKILRPRIYQKFKRDIDSLKFINFVIGIFSSYLKDKIQDVVNLLEDCLSKEINLTFEASAACDLKEKLKGVKGFYIPKIYWDLTTKKVLVSQWVNGIPFTNKKAIKNSKFDKREIAKNLVVSYFNQAYVHGIFHADMHLGNLFLMENGDIAAVDFGIIGTIDKKTRIAIAEILIAFLAKDYNRVAKLHIDAGLVPDDVNFEEFVLSCRIIGQSVVDKPVAEISMAKLLKKLLEMTEKFNMKTKPELLLLQKTIMLLEGVGVFLDKNLNIWELAKPFVKEWAEKNIGFDAKIRDLVVDYWRLFKRMPDEFSFDLYKRKIENLENEVKIRRKKELFWQISFFGVGAILVLYLVNV